MYKDARYEILSLSIIITRLISVSINFVQKVSSKQVSKWKIEGGGHLDCLVVVQRSHIPNFTVLASILPNLSKNPLILSQSKLVSK